MADDTFSSDAPAPPARRDDRTLVKRVATHRRTQKAAPYLSTIGLFVLWEGIVRLFGVPTYVLPTASESFIAVWEYRDAIWMHAAQTLYTTLAGFAIAVVFGVLLGALVGSSRAIYDAVNPLLIGFNSIPKVAVVPILVMWFGIGTVPAILTAFLISFFPIAVSVSIGLSTLEPEYRDILRSLGASQATIFWKIALPKTLPEFFGALKVAVTLAFIGTNLMEIVSPHGKGLGDLFDSGRISADYPLMFAVLLALAALGILLFYVVVILERIFAGWAERSPT